MVKKLFKHEFMALGRLMLPVIGAVLGLGIFARILECFQSDTTGFYIIEGSTYGVLFIAMFASMLLSTIFGVVRYYKNLFTSEGYLSFTLPVTPAQHLLVKVTVAVLFDVLAVTASILAFVISFAGEPLAEFWKAGVYLWNMAAKEVNMTHVVFFIIEFLILLLVSGFANYLTYYSCVTIGQTAKKNRVMWAVGVYFIYSMIGQTISTIVSVLLAAFADVIPFEEIFENIVTQHPYAFVHSILWIGALFCIIWATVCFFICHTIIRKKLNLE